VKSSVDPDGEGYLPLSLAISEAGPMAGPC
jgi:hypothetical protein